MALPRDSLAAPARTSVARYIARRLSRSEHFIHSYTRDLSLRVVKPAKHTFYPTPTSYCLGLSRSSDISNTPPSCVGAGTSSSPFVPYRSFGQILLGGADGPAPPGKTHAVDGRPQSTACPASSTGITNPRSRLPLTAPTVFYARPIRTGILLLPWQTTHRNGSLTVRSLARSHGAPPDARRPITLKDSPS
eukprot:scaffold1572_cov329-Prasinococcus_capsulatus_cf.AAC.2